MFTMGCCMAAYFAEAASGITAVYMFVSCHSRKMQVAEVDLANWTTTSTKRQPIFATACWVFWIFGSLVWDSLAIACN